MEKPQFIKPLKDVVHQPTRLITRKSKKTGNPYQAEVFDLKTMVLGPPNLKEKELEDGSKEVEYIYSIYDATNNLGYEIKAPNKIPTNGYTKALFKEITGGLIGNNGYWFNAKEVIPIKKEKQ